MYIVQAQYDLRLANQLMSQEYGRLMPKDKNTIRMSEEWGGRLLPKNKIMWSDSSPGSTCLRWQYCPHNSFTYCPLNSFSWNAKSLFPYRDGIIDILDNSFKFGTFQSGLYITTRCFSKDELGSDAEWLKVWSSIMSACNLLSGKEEFIVNSKQQQNLHQEVRSCHFCKHHPERETCNFFFFF